MARPVITVEIDFVSGVFATPTWTDVSDYVLRIPLIRRGRQNELGRFEAGTAEIVLDNADGRFSPGNTWSPYAGAITPMRRVRISATYNAVTYRLFTGYIEAWPPSWAGGLVGEVTIRCVDAFKILAQARVDYSWGVEFVTNRLVSVLVAAGFGLGDFNDFGGSSTQVAAVSLTTVAPLSHLLDVAEAEDGQFFVDGNGKFSFHVRHRRLSNTLSTTVQATFGDDDLRGPWTLGSSTLSVLGSTTIPRPDPWSGTTSELPYLRVEPSFDDSFIINDAQIAASGGSGTPQIASDSTSQAAYGVRSRAKTLILTSDSVAQDMASWLVLKNANPDVRFPRLVLAGDRDDALWPHILGREISDRVQVIKRYPGTSGLVRDCLIEAVEQRNITPDSWETVFSLSPATTGQYWILQDSVAGVLDLSTRLAY